MNIFSVTSAAAIDMGQYALSNEQRRIFGTLETEVTHQHDERYDMTVTVKLRSFIWMRIVVLYGPQTFGTKAVDDTPIASRNKLVDMVDNH